MTRIEFQDLLDEVVYFLRNQITDPKSRAIRKKAYFNGDGNIQTFTLTEPEIKNIVSVTVDDASQSYGTDYSVSLKTKANQSTITFSSAPSLGTNNVVIEYDYGKTWIYDQYPSIDIEKKSFPRISVDITSTTTRQGGIGNVGDFTSIILSVTIDGRNRKEVRDLISDIRNAFASNKQAFYNFSHITPVSVTPIVPLPGFPDRLGEMRRGVADFEIPFIWEPTS